MSKQQFLTIFKKIFSKNYNQPQNNNQVQNAHQVQNANQVQNVNQAQNDNNNIDSIIELVFRTK